MKEESIEIINKDGLSAEYILQEIRDIEEQKHRKVIKAEFVDNGDGTSRQRFWFSKVPFSRIRRITGYLVGDLNRFNDAKAQEVRDRVKHNT